MKTLNLVQGSAEWLAARQAHFCASDAPAMMGASKYKTRAELLRQKAGGSDVEVNSSMQGLFDRGHQAEAAIRPHVEAMIGEELFPITVVDDAGWLLASLDGQTMLGNINFEHKLWNEELAANVRAGKLDAMYYWQLEHQHAVNGAEKTIFVVSDGTPEKCVYMWYTPIAGRREQLIAGWKQFAEDLANYQHVEVKTEAIGHAPEALPALRIEVTGMVTASNLREFKDHALAVFAGINTDLQTDNDFANAEKTVKWCGEVEERLDAAKQHALSQTASIDELFRAIDQIKAEARAKRLELDKLVKARKETIRVEIKQEGELALRAHVDMLNKRLGGKIAIPAIAANFAGVMSGKKTVKSLRDAVDAELTRCKLEANALADRIEINLNSLHELATGHEFLFMDAQQLVLKANDDLVNLIKLRIAEHEAKEKARLDAERERIRAEEEAKAKAKAEADAKAAIQATQQTEPVARVVEPAAPARTINVQIDGKPATHAEVAYATGLARPTDAHIVATLSSAYGVNKAQVIEWLFDIDLTMLEEIA